MLTTDNVIEGHGVSLVLGAPSNASDTPKNSYHHDYMVLCASTAIPEMKHYLL